MQLRNKITLVRNITFSSLLFWRVLQLKAQKRQWLLLSLEAMDETVRDNNTETTGKVIHLIYTRYHLFIFEQLELLGLRPTSSAGKPITILCSNSQKNAALPGFKFYWPMLKT